MPFTSERQQRAAFGGHIPGFSKVKAKEWAAETDFSKLPNRAPAEKGKPTLRSKSASPIGYVAKQIGEQLKHPGTHKNMYDAARGEHDRRKHASDDFVDFCTKIAFAVPKPGKLLEQSSHVGSFPGHTTDNFLKPPGPTTAAGVTNPRLNIRNAMTKNMRA